MKYLIEVEATRRFVRTYAVEAEDEWAALEAYQAAEGNAEWVSDDLLNDFECDEHGDTACVYTDDDAKTLLIQAAEGMELAAEEDAYRRGL